MLNSATQEYIAATIIHEAIHAYIFYCQHQVQNGYMDTTSFKNLFPYFGLQMLHMPAGELIITPSVQVFNTRLCLAI
ncbi:MAG: hypothetical protein IPP11_05675 [Chitinophagaceae bacterium]|nr:hypothetical protein [Chitinophagaceae bacterium]